MGFEDNDFGGYTKKQDNSSNNANANENVDSSKGESGSPAGNANPSSSGNSGNMGASPGGGTQFPPTPNQMPKGGNDNDFGSFSKSGSSSSSGSGGDKEFMGGKRIEDMDKAEKAEAAMGDAQDLAAQNYAGVAWRHRADIKDKAPKVAAASLASKGASMTAKAALIQKGIGFLKNLFHLAANFAKAVFAKIGSVFAAAGHGIAGLFGISAIAGTTLASGGATLVVGLTIAMVVNLVNVNQISRTDYIDDCNPAEYNEDANLSAEQQAQNAADIALNYATHDPPYQYPKSLDGTYKFNVLTTDESTGDGIDCSHFVAKVLTEAGVEGVKEGKVATVHDSIKNDDIAKWTEGSPIQMSALKVGAVLIFGDSPDGTQEHTAIYLGDDEIAHASNRANGVCVTKLNYDESDGSCYNRHLMYVVYPYHGTKVNTNNDSGNADVSGKKLEVFNHYYSVCKAYGMNDVQCAGLLGNMKCEGGGTPYAVEDFPSTWELTPEKQKVMESMDSYVSYSQNHQKGSGYYYNGKPYVGIGCIQFTAARGYKMYAFAKETNNDWYDEGYQMAFMLSSKDAGSTFKKYKSKSFSSVDDAADWICENVERPKYKNYNDRRKAARTFLKQMKSGTYTYDAEYGKKYVDYAVEISDAGFLDDSLASENSLLSLLAGGDGCGGEMKNNSGWVATGNMKSGEVDGEMCNYLEFDPRLIFKTLGTQGSSQCGVYSCAYGYTVMTGRCRVSGSPASHQAVANKYNGGSFAICQWSTMKLKDVKYSGVEERYKAAFEEVTQNHKPVIVSAQGSSSNHFLCIIGFTANANPNNLKQEDFVVLDPAQSGEGILCRYGVGSFGKNINGSSYGKHLYFFPDGAKE